MMGVWYVASLLTCALRAEHGDAWQMPLKSPRGWAEPLKQTRRMMYAAVPAGAVRKPRRRRLPLVNRL